MLAGLDLEITAGHATAFEQSTVAETVDMFAVLYPGPMAVTWCWHSNLPW